MTPATIQLRAITNFLLFELSFSKSAFSPKGKAVVVAAAEEGAARKVGVNSEKKNQTKGKKDMLCVRVREGVEKSVM